MLDKHIASFMIVEILCRQNLVTGKGVNLFYNVLEERMLMFLKRPLKLEYTQCLFITVLGREKKPKSLIHYFMFFFFL